MSDNKWTQANRLTEVIRHEVRREAVGKGLCPSVEVLQKYYPGEFSEIRVGDPVWTVHLEMRTGLDKLATSFRTFASEDAAKDAVKSRPVGRKYGDGIGYPVRFQEFAQNAPTNPNRILSDLFTVFEGHSIDGICYDALSGAGVKTEAGYSTSDAVKEWVGSDTIAWMKEAFGENWSVVAEFEYSINHFPRLSLACLASQLFLAQYVTEDDFSVGYLTKEIQVIAGGTEQAASHSTEIRKKAGQGGARASRDRRQANLETLMQEIEKLADVVGLIGEDLIVAQAFENARTSQPKMPGTKRTLDDYGTTLRSEEPFKSRYEAVFRKNA